MYFADLHIHSRFSRATSRDCDLPHLDWWARCKGIQLVGTGDFTHPAWRAEWKELLIPDGLGFYTLREEARLPDEAPGETPRFVVSGEISSIYKRHGKTRKVHNVILLPSLEAADELAARLEAIGNLHSDGRPILGLDSRDLLELTLETCPDAELIPAHIWTPHFSVFGAFSGFDSLEECFGDLTPQIHAVETGLSSDPPMNWRVSQLDGLTLVSHSDAHSPAKLGREADRLDTGLSYPELLHALRTGEGFLGTVEFFPEEGKYHLDGHRNCGVCLTPAETEQRGGLCPVCGKKLTIGVEHRVEELADRPAGFRPSGAKPYESLAPLPEVIAASTGHSAAGKQTQALYEQMLRTLGPEFQILRETPIPDIEAAAGPCVAEGIRRLRLGQVERRPGFDGEYGVISLLTPAERERLNGQLSLFAPETARRPAKRTGSAKRASAAVGRTAQGAHPAALNPQQQAAVTAEEAVVAAVAGPGTGKTNTLTARIAWLVEEKGVRPEEITAVTFTNQAAEEMRRRLEARLGGKRAVARMTIGTFHAICLELLGDVRLAGRMTTLDLAAQACGELHSRKRPGSVLRAVSQIKNGATPEDAGLSLELYDAYCARLRAAGALDFDDLLLEARKVDTTGRRAFRHLLVDEFQDINDVQYELLLRWHQGGQSLFVIGDPDQSIYGFRGASGRCFQRLRGDFPALREIALQENYRSSPEILNAAQAVLARDSGDAPALTPRCPSGPAVRLVQAESSFAEGVFVAKEISRMTGGVDMLEAQALGAERGSRSFSDIAVLCRTHRQLEQLESCLHHDGIPCLVSGWDAVLEADEVRGALAFLHSLSDRTDLAAVETALRLLWRCPEELLPQARALWRNTEPAALESAVAEIPPLQAWAQRAAQWFPLPAKEKPREQIGRWIAQFGSTPALERLLSTAALYDNVDSLWRALILGEEADLRRADGKGWESGAVRLMTLHASKGLEFPVVFVAGLDAGALPLERPGCPADGGEERRLLYVGMTRAREELILTAGPELSPFLKDLPASVRREHVQKRERPAEQLSLFTLP